jgi:hypothetical protein
MLPGARLQDLYDMFNQRRETYLNIIDKSEQVFLRLNTKKGVLTSDCSEGGESDDQELLDEEENNKAKNDNVVLNKTYTLKKESMESL